MEDDDFNELGLSIIIPVYNMEEYIEKCILKIINSSLSNYELIVVDDGSTDLSGKIIMKIAEKNNIVHYFKKNNGGVSSARNFGLREAKGKWILFVDADDLLFADRLSDFFTKEIVDADIICFKTTEEKLSDFQSNEKEVVYYNGNFRESLINALFGIHTNEQLKQYRLAGPVAKLYSRKFIEKNKIRFNTNLHMGEDQIFNLQSFKIISNIALVDEVSYYIERNEVSASRKYKQFDFNNEYFKELRKELDDSELSKHIYWHAIYGNLIYNLRTCICHKASSQSLKQKLRILREYYSLYNVSTSRNYIKYSEFGRKRSIIIWAFLNKYFSLVIIFGKYFV